MRSSDDDLALALRALGNPTRLALLRRLRTAAHASDIALPPRRRGDGWGPPSRAMTRQALRRHIRALESAGLIAREREGRAERYRVRPERVAWLIERLNAFAADER